MKRTTIAVVLFGLSTALAATAFAQGRHDDKPHGSAKPSASSAESKYEPMPGGRHDEKPHGPRKLSKKAQSEKADAKKSSDTDKAVK
jgi:hypothetical protein